MKGAQKFAILRYIQNFPSIRDWHPIKRRRQLELLSRVEEEISFSQRRFHERQKICVTRDVTALDNKKYILEKK